MEIGEVVKYTTESYPSAMSSGLFVVMNKKVWESLPPDLQKIVDGLDQEWVDKVAYTWDEVDKEGKEFAMKKREQNYSPVKRRGGALEEGRPARARQLRKDDEGKRTAGRPSAQILLRTT